MDTQAKINPEKPTGPTASLPLLLDQRELLKVRVLPAEFARLLGVSKQTVSQWIKAGKLTVNPLDGRLDVQAAVQQVLRNTDPGRLRARVLRQAVEDVQALRGEITRLADQNERLLLDLDAAKTWQPWAQELEARGDQFKALLVEREADMRATKGSAAWSALLDEIELAAVAACEAGTEDWGGAIPSDEELASVMAPEGWQPVGD